MLPNLIIAGFQKAGTTALGVNLSAHPQVAVADSEAHFFSDRWDQGFSWYESFLERKTETGGGNVPIYLGEKSPEYATRPDALDRMRDALPDVKILLCVRNPITRAYSRYVDILEDEPSRLSGAGFDEIVAKAIRYDQHWVRNGLYSVHLQNVLARFPREAIFVVVQERMLSSPNDEMARLFKYLGLDPPPPRSHQHVHQGIYGSKMSARSRKKLREYFYRDVHMLREMLGDDLSEWGDF
ncbi:MAG: sulfotransferase family protein [Pseudomonadota bacterium]